MVGNTCNYPSYLSTDPGGWPGKFKTSLGYTLSFIPAWATEKTIYQQKQRNRKPTNRIKEAGGIKD